MNSYLPIYDIKSNVITEGLLIVHPNDCNKKVSKYDCKQFYSSISEDKGFHVCPYGFNAYTTEQLSDGSRIIFTGFRVSNSAEKLKHKNFTGIGNRNPILDKEFITKLIEQTLLNQNIENTVVNLKDFFEALKHETTLWSTEIINLSEKLYNQSKGKKKEKGIYDISKKIYHYSSLIDINFRRFDLLNDTLTTSSGQKVRLPIHKRFHSVTMCLESMAKTKGILFCTHGETYQHSLINIETFDLLPFLILENAIKYSPNNSNISIAYKDLSNNFVEVQIESIGPLILDEEKDKIFMRGFRGKYVLESRNKYSGSGIGLFLVKKVANNHNIDLSVKSVAQKNGFGLNTFILRIPCE